MVMALQDPNWTGCTPTTKYTTSWTGITNVTLCRMSLARITKRLTSRTTSSTTGRRDSSIITKTTYKHKDFRRQAILEYGQLLQEDLLESTVPRRLLLIKRAMHNAAKCIGKDIEANVAASALDKVEWSMAFIQAVEKQNLQRMRQSAKACPCPFNYCDPNNPRSGLLAVSRNLKVWWLGGVGKT